MKREQEWIFLMVNLHISLFYENNVKYYNARCIHPYDGADYSKRIARTSAYTPA